MVNLNAFAQIFSVGTAAWALVAMLGVALFAAWPRIMEQLNKGKVDRASIEAGQYERMDARLQRLEVAEEKCRADLADARGRIAELEGYLMGRGEAMQTAQRMLSAARVTDAKKAKPDG